MQEIISQQQYNSIAAFLNRENHQMPLFLNAHNCCSYYLEFRQKITAVVSISENSFHPNYLKIWLYSNSPEPFESIQLICHTLRDKFSSHKQGLKYILDDSNTYHKELTSIGFKNVMCGYIAEVHSKSSLESLSDFHALSDNLEIICYDDLTPCQLNTLNYFRRLGYHQSHKWNTPTPINDDIWKSTDVNQTDMALSYAVFDDNDVVVASDLHDEGHDMYFGWFHYNNSHVDYKRAVKTVLHHQLTQEKPLFIEVDNTSPCALFQASCMNLDSKRNQYAHYHWDF